MIESPLLSLGSQSGETPFKNTPTYSLHNCKRSMLHFVPWILIENSKFSPWLSIRWNPYERIPKRPAQVFTIVLPLQLHSSTAETLYIINRDKYSTTLYFCIPVNFWIRDHFLLRCKMMLINKNMLVASFFVSFKFSKINKGLKTA